MRHRSGTHQKARAYLFHQFGHFRKQAAHAYAAQIRARKPCKRGDFHAETAVIALFVARETIDKIFADFLAGEHGKGIPSHAEFFHRLFQRPHGTTRQIGIGGNIDRKEILIHVLFKTRKNVRPRKFSAFQRLADEIAAEFFQIRHRLFIHTPVGKHIEVIDQRAGF